MLEIEFDDRSIALGVVKTYERIRIESSGGRNHAICVTIGDDAAGIVAARRPNDEVKRQYRRRIMECTRSFRRLGLLSIALLVAVTVAGCGDNGEGDEGDTTAASGCEEVNALEDSLRSLTQIEPVDDGIDALESAAAEVKTDLEAAASAVTSDLQPTVDEVRTSFDELETTLEGISSEGGLGAAATEVRSALTQLGTALADLSAEIGERC